MLERLASRLEPIEPADDDPAETREWFDALDFGLLAWRRRARRVSSGFAGEARR